MPLWCVEWLVFLIQPYADPAQRRRLYRLWEMREGLPSQLPVDTLVQIRSAECLGCLECVAICPAENALDLSLIGAKPLNHRTPWAVAAGISLLFFGVLGYAKVTRHWDTYIPDQVYQRLIPNADEYGHPH